MPRIPTIQSSGDVGKAYFAGGGNMAAAGATQASADSIAQGLGVVSSVLMTQDRRNKVNAAEAQQNAAQIAAKAAQRQEYTDTLWSESQYTEAQRTWIQWSNDVQKTGEEDVVGKFNNDYPKFQSDMLKGAPTPQARERLKMKLDDLGTRIFDTSLRVQAANQSKNTISTFGQMISTSIDTVAQAPEIYAVEQQRLGAMLKMSLDHGRITEDIYQKGMDQVNELAANAAEAVLGSNPARAKQIIDSAEGIPWARRKSILSQVEQANNTNDNLFSYQQQELFKSSVDSLASTGKPADGFNVDLYVASFPEGRQAAAREEATKQIKVAETVYSARIDMNGKTPSQIGEVLSKHEPKAGSTTFSTDQAVYGELLKVADAQVKQFRTDPFTYSRQDPVVSKAWTMVESLPENADPQLRASLTSQALESSVNFQKAAGIPEANLTVLSRQSAIELATQINQGDVKQTQQALGSMMQTYGKYYPYAFRTLVSLPEGQRIDASMQIAALHYGKPFLGDFLQAIKVPDADYKLDPSDRKVLKQKLPVDKNFLAFGSSMTSANPAAVPMVTEFGQAIEKYATSLVARGKASSPSEAVKQASNLIIGQAYGFALVDDTPLAVKRQQGGTHLDDKDVSSIQSSLYSIRSKMEASAVDTSRFGFPVGLSEDVKSKSVQDTLRTDTFWVTNPANDGAQLFMFGMDGTTAPVKLKDGKPMEVKFLDALSQQKVELAKRNTAAYQAQAFVP